MMPKTMLFIRSLSYSPAATPYGMLPPSGRDALLPPRLQRVGDRRRHAHPRLPDGPAKAAERRRGELVEGDQRQIAQEIEPQLQVVRRTPQRRLGGDPVDVGPGLAKRVPGPDQPLGRHAEANEECARSGFERARASAGPFDVDVAPGRDAPPLPPERRPIPQ